MRENRRREGAGHGREAVVLFRVIRLMAAGAVALGFAACVPVATEVPAWAIHVRPSVFDPQYPDDQVLARLTGELRMPHLPQRHLAPEQIAFRGLAEISQGRPGDAALWLAIASYRYHEEARQVLGAAESPPPYGVNVRGYGKYLLN